ncbi:MAG TPA: cache domain-containing protein [bacterium]|nr:cache domain-containing protein [bacterium]
MSRRPWGISHKFIMLVSAAVAVFMVTAFVVTRTMLEDYALRAADETAGIILDQTDKRLITFFSELEALSRSLASMQPVQRIDPDAMRDIFIASVNARSAYLRAIYLGTADGRMYEWGVGAEFVDNTPKFPEGYDPRTRPWYRSTMERGDFSVSSPYRYASVDDIGITCALPVKTGDGSVAGVVGMDILLRSLGSVLDGLEIPKGGKAIILGSGGEIIASQFAQDRPEGMILKRFEAGDVLKAPAGSFLGSIGGQATQFVHRRIEGLDWIVVVALPLAPIRNSVRALLDLIGLVEASLMVALVLALAFISGRLIVAPLGHIVSVMNRVESGQKGVRVSVNTSDEFGFLGDEFNRLLDTIEEYSTTLEAKVRSRTDEIGKLQRENTKLRVIEERRRIYRDMHDTIGAKLTNIFFCNSVARDLAKDGPGRLLEMLATIEANCLDAIGSLKGIILGMSEDDRRASSFSLTVSAGVRNRLEARGIALDCRIRNKHALENLPAGHREELEKIIDELVSNVLKHSGARHVRMRLSTGAKGILLRFSDDGSGFDQGGRISGSGLGNIRYRIEALGGTVRLQTSPGAGTAYAIAIPAVSTGVHR